MKAFLEKPFFVFCLCCVFQNIDAGEIFVQFTAGQFFFVSREKRSYGHFEFFRTPWFFLGFSLRRKCNSLFFQNIDARGRPNRPPFVRYFSFLDLG